MENQIYICNMECYQKAPQGQKEKVKPDWAFDLGELPAEGMQTEFRCFLEERAKTIAVATMVHERNCYNRMCRFLQDMNSKSCSFRDKPLEEWIKKLNAWLMRQGMARTEQRISVYGKEKTEPSDVITYLRKIYYFTQEHDTREETEKDVWDLGRIGVLYKTNLIKNFETLNFTEIIQPAIKEETKKAVLRHLQYEALATIDRKSVV